MQIRQSLVLIIIICFYLLNSNIFPNENNIVVTGSKNGNKDSSTASSAVTAKDIEEKQSITTGDAVREMPGVFVSGDGRTGQSQYIFVRGFRSSDVLILIDGVEMTNPLSPNGAADLSISPENIAKVELMKGPQSVLYGSGAIAGVMDIQTKKGYGKPSFSSSFSTAVLDMSSERYIPDTFNANISSMGGNGSFFYNTGASFFFTEGISMADSFKRVKEGLYEKIPDDDRAIKGNLYFRTGIEIDSNNDWELFLKAGKGELEIDDGPGLGSDDPDRFLDSKDLVLRSVMDSSFFGKIWNMKTAFSIRMNSLEDSDKADTGKVNGNMESGYNSFQTSIKLENLVKSADWHELSAGFELKKEWGDAHYIDYLSGRKLDLSFDPSPDISTGLYAFNVFKPLKNLDISAGIRLQNNFYQIRLADKTTDRLLNPENIKSIEPLFSGGISYETPSQTIFKARVARGVRTPTLFQRFSTFADIYNELKPETAWGFDGIAAQYLMDKKIKIEAGYFYELKKNHIDLDKSGKFSNTYMIENHGIEVGLETKPIYGLSLSASYTWIFKMKEFRVVELDGKKYKDKIDVLRRPAHTFNAVFNYNLKKIFNVCFSLNYVGDRIDEVYNYPKTPYITAIDGFVLLDVAISFKINRYISVFAKIENMLDNDSYAYSVEYGTSGITPWLGLKFDIGG